MVAMTTSDCHHGNINMIETSTLSCQNIIITQYIDSNIWKLVGRYALFKIISLTTRVGRENQNNWKNTSFAEWVCQAPFLPLSPESGHQLEIRWLSVYMNWHHLYLKKKINVFQHPSFPKSLMLTSFIQLKLITCYYKYSNMKKYLSLA